MHTDSFITDCSGCELELLAAVGVADSYFSRDRGSTRCFRPEELVEDLSLAIRIKVQLVVHDVASADIGYVFHAVGVRARHVVPDVLPPAKASFNDFEFVRDKHQSFVCIAFNQLQVVFPAQH